MELHMAATEDIVRYLKGKGTARMIERMLTNVKLDFRIVNGNMQLFIRGQGLKDIELAREKIENVIDTGLSQVMTLSYHQASTLCKTHPAEIVNIFRDNTILVGWHVDRRSNNLRLFGDSAEQLSTAFILLLDIVSASSNKHQRRRPVLPQDFPRQGHNRSMGRFQGYSGRQQSALYKANHPIGDLKLESFRYLRASDALRSIGDILGVKTAFEKINHRSHITVEGNRPAVEQALVRIKENIDALCVEEITRDQEIIVCLKELSNNEIVSSLKLANVTAGWDLRERSLWLCGEGKPQVRKAAEVIFGLITTGEYPQSCDLVDAQLKAISNRSGWLGLSNMLAKAHPGTHLWHAADFKKVHFAAKHTEIEFKAAIVRSLDSFFMPLAIKEMIIPIPPDISRYVQRYNRIFDKTWNTLAEHPVTIELSDSSFVLKSISDSALKKAEINAPVIFGSIKSKDTYATRRVQIAWLKSSEALARLNDISLRTMTVFDIYAPPTPTADKSPAASRSAVTSSSHPMSLSTSAETSGLTSNTFKLVSGDISKTCHENRIQGIFSSQGIISKTLTQIFLKNQFNLCHGWQRFRSETSDERYDVSVYHAILPRKSGNKAHIQTLKAELLAALQCFTKEGATTLAFPAIGTGRLNYDPVEVVDVLVDTVTEYMEEHHTHCFTKVYFVVHPDNKICYEQFEEKLLSIQAQLSSKREPIAAELKMSPERLGIRFQGETDSCTKAIDALEKELDKLLSEDDWTDSPQRKWIPKLTLKQKQSIWRHATDRDVRIDFTDDNITMQGDRDDIKTLRNMIDKILIQFIETTETLPLHWDMSQMKNGYAQVTLKQYVQADDEYQKVSNLFFERTGGAYLSAVRITEIIRIQNEPLYMQYTMQKKRVTNEVKDSTLVERQLWHGTDATTVFQICRQEFNRSFCGRHGVAYGQGSYFSTSSAYSMKYAKGTGERYMILAKVVTGVYCLGNSSTDRTNLKPGYHSTVDSINNPNTFVVYHDAAAYPEYVIKFNYSYGFN